MLEEKSAQGDFWLDNESAKKVIKRLNELKLWTVPYQELVDRFNSFKELWPEAKEEEALVEEFQSELQGIEKKLATLELKKMLSGEMDSKSCFCSINAGAGGTESCDWVSMLSRMYERWATRKGWKFEVIDRVEGEVAGIKSITYRFDGSFAYGYCKSEKGVHRLVRISPFDSNARRHTSFASVDITPIIDDDVVVEIRPEDLRIDTYRSSGAGGQHVNVTDSAVRICHIPTGIVVSSQSERSQIQNKETCIKMLRAKLYEMKMEEREAKLKDISGEKKEIAWGSQIRSYTFQPYTLVKDNRTKYESFNVQAVMDGELDGFVEAYLKYCGG